MTEAQIHRYARHISLGSVGYRGQQRLLAASVAIELSGNPASHCAAVYLAAAGVGQLGVRGGDQTLCAADITRSLVFRAEDIGARRVDALRRRLAELNSDVEVVLADDRAELIPIPAADTLADGLRLGCAVASQKVAALSEGLS